MLRTDDRGDVGLVGAIHVNTARASGLVTQSATGVWVHLEAVGATSPIPPNVIWAMDFRFDTTAGGRGTKMFNVIDEFTRKAFAIEVHRSIDADGVVALLDRLAVVRGYRPTSASIADKGSSLTP